MPIKTQQCGFLFSLLKFSFSEKTTKICASSSWFCHLLSKFQNHGEDCANLCGLLKKAELYWQKCKKLLWNWFFLQYLHTIFLIWHLISKLKQPEIRTDSAALIPDLENLGLYSAFWGLQSISKFCRIGKYFSTKISVEKEEATSNDLIYVRKLLHCLTWKNLSH